MGRSFRETITAKLRQAYKPKAVPRAGAAFCFAFSPRAAAPQYGHRPTENRDGKTAFRERKNRKLIFSTFYPHGRKEKKQGTYFKIRALYFKISQTYFLPPENYIETCPEKADKNRRCFYARCERHFPCRQQHMQNRLCSRRIVKFWPIFEKLHLLCPSIMKILL